MSTPPDSRAASSEATGNARETDAELVSWHENAAFSWGNERDEGYIAECGEDCEARRREVLDRFAALRSQLAEREAECARLRGDANRYRMIREMGWSIEFNGLWTGAEGWRVHDHELRYHYATSLDEAVDKARAAVPATAAREERNP